MYKNECEWEMEVQAKEVCMKVINLENVGNFSDLSVDLSTFKKCFENEMNFLRTGEGQSSSHLIATIYDSKSTKEVENEEQEVKGEDATEQHPTDNHTKVEVEAVPAQVEHTVVQIEEHVKPVVTEQTHSVVVEHSETVKHEVPHVHLESTNTQVQAQQKEEQVHTQVSEVKVHHVELEKVKPVEATIETHEDKKRVDEIKENIISSTVHHNTEHGNNQDFHNVQDHSTLAVVVESKNDISLFNDNHGSSDSDLFYHDDSESDNESHDSY